MKTNIRFISMVLILISALSVTPQRLSAQGVSVSFQVFYDELSPYGTWVNNDDYGYVWVPDVAPGFTPYGTNGYWVFTDEGWTWVSDYPWGWAPFHYGRWFYDASYGPMWVPDNQWGPGWVTWRRSSGYYGWAPIGPGVSISIAYGNGYNPPHDQWRFVRENDFGRTHINNYYVNTTNNVTIINNSTVINNIHENKTRNVSYNAGPERVEVEKNTGRTIAPVVIKENAKPGQHLNKGELDIYRPRVENNNAAASKPVPAKVSNLKDVKPASQRNVERPGEKENGPGKVQQTDQQHNAKPAEQKQPSSEGQPARHQQQAAPVKHEQPQHNAQPKIIDKAQPSREGQPVKQQSPKQTQPARQEPSQPRHEAQPVRQEPSQPQREAQPERQEPAQPKQEVQPARQSPAQQQRSNHTVKPASPKSGERNQPPHQEHAPKQ